MHNCCDYFYLLRPRAWQAWNVIATLENWMPSFWPVWSHRARVTPASPTGKPRSHAGQWYLEIASWCFGFFSPKAPNVFHSISWHTEVSHSAVEFLLGLVLKILCQSKQNRSPSFLQWPNFETNAGICQSLYSQAFRSSRLPLLTDY